MSLCQYANALGRPREGVHADRIGDTAAVDLLATVAIAKVTQHFTGGPFAVILVGWLVAGEVAHYAFCVPTAWQVVLGLQRDAALSTSTPSN